MEHLLNKNSIDPNTESNTLLGLEFKKPENILQEATETSIEGHKRHAGSTKPRCRGKWNSEIAEASQHSRAIHKEIKEKGYANREVKEKQNEAKRKLRWLQRQQAHYERATLYKEIVETEKEDQQLFYKLVNKQRKTPQQTTNAIIMEGIELTTQGEILSGWKLHFQKLATPNNENFSTDKFGRTN